MAPIRSIVAATLLFLSAANAHFELLKPTPLEGDNMNEDLEPNAPCGGGSADLSKNTATDFHVDGDSVTVLLAHPQADYLFRATLDTHAAGNWTQLWPIFTHSGRGNFCEPAVTAPKEWAGKKGFVGIACNAPDGILYQCAAVNFVSGANTSPGSCTNGTSVSASFNTVPALSSLVGSSNSTSTTPSPSSATSAKPSASSSGSSAASLLARGGGLPIGSLAASAAMVLVGASLL